MRPEGAEPGRAVPKGSVLWSFRAAFAGVARTVACQRNMKLHVLSALMVMIVGMALPLDLSTRVALLFAVGVVFFAEILNTGLEALVDLYIGDFHRLAMLAKDAAAAGVLVLALVTVLILAEILLMRWDLVTASLEAVWRSVLFGVPLVLVEALGLFLVRRGPVAVVRFLVAIALLVPLVRHSEDPIFAGIAVALVALSAYARHAFPSRPGRGAPPTAGVAA
jgi:diacylglycerol kinase (ATP)